MGNTSEADWHNMKTSETVINIITKAKPVLLKFFPHAFLKKMKGKMVERTFRQMEEISIKPFKRLEHTDGVNLIGNIRAETGLGQSCRLVADELAGSGISYSLYQYDQLGDMAERSYSKYEEKLSSELPYNINLIHINPYDLGLAFIQNHTMWDGRYNIGFWLWESEDFPEEWVPCFHCLNEIWTPSEFISRSIRKKTQLPVITVPYHMEIPGDTKADRIGFGLPEGQFLFLLMYDRATGRKNPEGVVEAFKRAFRPDENAGLVIKISNCTEDELKRLKTHLGNYQNVYFLTEVMTREQINCLMKSVDALVSLHRAEGFGLVMAEAMLLGKPAIATNWSANTEFMTPETACLVDCQMVELKKDEGLFKKGSRWAEPDVGQAAEYMRRLYEDEAFYRRISERAAAEIRQRLSMEQASARIRERLEQIYGN